MRKTSVMLLLAPLATLAAAPSAVAQQQPGALDKGAGESARQSRQLVELPAPMRERILSNMDEHMLALHEINNALAHNQEDNAAKIAEERLGLTSIKARGGHERAKFLPEGMRDIGRQMHRAASQFAVEAQKAGVTGDLRPALGALAKVTAQCVACHAAYRLR